MLGVCAGGLSAEHRQQRGQVAHGPQSGRNPPLAGTKPPLTPPAKEPNAFKSPGEGRGALSLRSFPPLDTFRCQRYSATASLPIKPA